MKQEQVLLVFVSVVLFFGFLSSSLHGSSVSGQTVKDDISLRDIQCTWNEGSFEACMTVDWSSLDGSYAKAYFIGGTPLRDVTPLREASSVFCDSVGDKEAVRGGGVYVYDDRGTVLDVRKDISVLCRRPALVSSTFHDRATFTAWATSTREQPAQGSGEVIFTLPRKPVSCRLSGTWATNNQISHSPLLGGNIPPGYCHGYKGSFESDVSLLEQSVVSDPASFQLAGKSQSAVDLAPYTMNGYVFHAWLCDLNWLFYEDRRYYARAFISAFDNDLVLSWEYLSGDPMPAVDVTVDVDCELTDESSSQRKRVIRLDDGVVTSPDEYESFALDREAFIEPPLEHPVAVRPLSFLTKLVLTVRGLFGGGNE